MSLFPVTWKPLLIFPPFKQLRFVTCRLYSIHDRSIWQQWMALKLYSIPVVSTGGTRTPRGTRRHLRGYVKFKISIYILFHEWTEIHYFGFNLF
jgi:hypothetical protein